MHFEHRPIGYLVRRIVIIISFEDSIMRQFILNPAEFNLPLYHKVSQFPLFRKNMLNVFGQSRNYLVRPDFHMRLLERKTLRSQ